jgi:hypothetical protein
MPPYVGTHSHAHAHGRPGPACPRECQQPCASVRHACRRLRAHRAAQRPRPGCPSSQACVRVLRAYCCCWCAVCFVLCASERERPLLQSARDREGVRARARQGGSESEPECARGRRETGRKRESQGLDNGLRIGAHWRASDNCLRIAATHVTRMLKHACDACQALHGCQASHACQASHGPRALRRSVLGAPTRRGAGAGHASVFRSAGSRVHASFDSPVRGL